MKMRKVEVVGFGLAGACVALEFQRRGFTVQVLDDGEKGSTTVAAGLVNPVAGRNFEPAEEFADAWEIATEFYQSLLPKLFTSVPIFRLWRDDKDRAKFERKRDRLREFISEADDSGVTWKGGGWLNCCEFLSRAKEEFLGRGGIWNGEESLEPDSRVWCTGAKGLIKEEFPKISHRCAKGEILTVEVPGWNEKRILNRNGWVIPIGGVSYRVGATYVWDQLDSNPTMEGREKVEEILSTFTDRPFRIVDHVAGIRPIISRSRPVIQHEPNLGWMLNGLGSKGVIYAPRAARQLVDRYIDSAPK